MPPTTPAATAAVETVIHVPPAQTVTNRYQTRVIDRESPAYIELRDDIRANGQRQPATGRRHPDQPGKIELANGHRRREVCAELGIDLAVIVRDLSDRQLFEDCARENFQREDPNALEKREQLLIYIRDFKATQEQAGKLFGLGQTAVSHLMRLGDLPEAVQDLVRSRALPERLARRLVVIGKWDAKLAVKIAKAAAAAEADERELVFNNALHEALQNRSENLGYDWRTPWPLEWPGTPIAVKGASAARGEPAELPACTGCPFNLKFDDDHYCLNPACHKIKGEQWKRHQAEKAAERLGIPMAAAGEKVQVYFAGGYDSREIERASKLVRAKRPELRLVISDVRNKYGLHQVFGAEGVALAVTDKRAVDQWLEETKGKPAKAAAPKNETPAQRARRVNGEKEIQEERWHERSIFHRARADVLWMLDRAAQLVADQTVAAGGMLAWASTRCNDGYSYSTWCPEINARKKILAGLAEVENLDHLEGGYKALPESTTLDWQRRHYIAYAVLAATAAGQQPPTHVYGRFDEVREDVESHALEVFGVQLPAGWAAPPIHRTHYNCWTCGAFAGNDKGFTKDEKKKGWVAFVRLGGGSDVVAAPEAGESTKNLAGVFCPVHAIDGSAKLVGKPLAKVLTAESKPAPISVPHPQGAAGSKTNGRGHTAHKTVASARAFARKAAKTRPAARPLRPAPKPSQQKRKPGRKTKTPARARVQAKGR